MLDKDKFSKLMGITGEVFGKPASPEVAAMYYQILKDFTDEEVEKAFYNVLKTHKFETFPKPANILEHIPKKGIDQWIIIKRETWA